MKPPSMRSLFFLLLALGFSADSRGQDRGPAIFPVPLQTTARDGSFRVDKDVFIALAARATAKDSFLSGVISRDFSGKWQLAVDVSRRVHLTGPERFILAGPLSNPLVRQYCIQHGLLADLEQLGPEGYVLSVDTGHIVVAANTDRGALYGVESLRQVMARDGAGVFVPAMMVRDEPAFPFRGIKLYLPGKDDIPFFKRFIRDFAALYKFNKIILELNANMRFERHPELNTAAVAFARHLNYSRLGRPPGLHKEYQNSSHQDNADGGILEKSDLAALVTYMRSYGLEVIPELPSLTHSYYLLGGHRDLAENPYQPYPDTYCPLKPEIYEIYFDVLDEYIDVIHPSLIHVGHDEWRVEKDVCELCKGRDYGKLYADDLKKIHDHLAKKGIKIAIWGDHLLQSVRGKGYRVWKTSTGYSYKIPAALQPQQVSSLIPKDILLFNWFWSDSSNDRKLSDFGFRQVYGNMRPEIGDLQARKDVKGILGGAPSSWAATTEFNIGKDQLYDFLVSANLLWSVHYLPEKEQAFAIEPMIAGIRENLAGTMLPSGEGARVRPVDLSGHFNFAFRDDSALQNVRLAAGTLRSGAAVFDLSKNRGKAIVVHDGGRSAESVPVAGIGTDVSSLIFLQACAREAVNEKAYEKIYDFDDTAEPLAYYEVTYEDGLVETIPIRYGVNILDWRWRQRIDSGAPDKIKYNQNKYAYRAPAVACAAPGSQPVTFFSFEWRNPRFGKKIAAISLHSLHEKKGKDNAVILLALSMTENKAVKEAAGTEDQ